MLRFMHDECGPYRIRYGAVMDRLKRNAEFAAEMAQNRCYEVDDVNAFFGGETDWQEISQLFFQAVMKFMAAVVYLGPSEFNFMAEGVAMEIEKEATA